VFVNYTKKVIFKNKNKSDFWKNGFWEKLILIEFHFRVKIDFFDKMIFLKILNEHLKMTKVIFFYTK